LLSCLILFLIGVLIYKIYILNNKYFFIIGSILLTISLIGNFKIFLFSPAVIILFISAEKKIFKNLKKICLFLGNLSYSSYLWHYPLAVLIIFILRDKNDILSNNLFFIFYIFAVLLLSYFSFKYVETKAKSFFRKLFS